MVDGFTWNVGQENCVQKGGQLISFENYRTEEELKTFVSTTGKLFFELFVTFRIFFSYHHCFILMLLSFLYKKI